jgi:hypothetical protein
MAGGRSSRPSSPAGPTTTSTTTGTPSSRRRPWQQRPAVAAEPPSPRRQRRGSRRPPPRPSLAPTATRTSAPRTRSGGTPVSSYVRFDAPWTQLAPVPIAAARVDGAWTPAAATIIRLMGTRGSLAAAAVSSHSRTAATSSAGYSLVGQVPGAPLGVLLSQHGRDMGRCCRRPRRQTAA